MGDRVTAGDIYAIVPENTLMTHKVMVPPGARGNITWIADKGQYDISEDVIEIEFAGQKKARRSWLIGSITEGWLDMPKNLPLAGMACGHLASMYSKA